MNFSTELSIHTYKSNSIEAYSCYCFNETIWIRWLSRFTDHHMLMVRPEVHLPYNLIKATYAFKALFNRKFIWNYVYLIIQMWIMYTWMFRIVPPHSISFKTQQNYFFFGYLSFVDFCYCNYTCCILLNFRSICWHYMARLRL